LRPLSIGHSEPQGMPSRGISERFRQRVHAFFASFERFSTQVLHHAADFLRRSSRRQRLSKRDAHGIRNPPRKFPKKTAAREAENRAPHAIQIYRNDGHFHALDDAFHASAERHHLPNARHLPFRKDAHHLAVFQRFGGAA